MTAKKFTKTQQRAKDLAVSYHHYHVALEALDVSGIIIWGSSLIDAQDECGFEMIEREYLERRIELARSTKRAAA